AVLDQDIFRHTGKFNGDAQIPGRPRKVADLQKINDPEPFAWDDEVDQEEEKENEHDRRQSNSKIALFPIIVFTPRIAVEPCKAVPDLFGPTGLHRNTVY